MIIAIAIMTVVVAGLFLARRADRAYAASTKEDVISALKNVIDEGPPDSCGCHDEFDLFLGHRIDDPYLDSFRTRALAICQADIRTGPKDLSPDGE